MSDDDMECMDLVGPFKPDMEKVRRKLRNLPTAAALAAEVDPNRLEEGELGKAEVIIKQLLDANPLSEVEFNRALKPIRKQYKIDCKKSFLQAGYQSLIGAGKIRPHPFLHEHLVSKATRSQSGVLVVTVFTSAFPEDENGVKQKFSCQWNCYYCPNEPNQPRSYLLNEPGVRRANRMEFDAMGQFNDRVDALVAIGHPADKVELLVLGGTWESYPAYYRETFIRDLFYAANVYFDPTPKRTKMDLLQEQLANETARCKLIGVTLETRPDTINSAMIVELRRLGCTRVQIGVQHTDDRVLTAVNREATRSDTVRALRLLKDACFKVDIHLMPDLPGTTPENDIIMFNDVLNSQDLQADQWKIYPCQTVPFSVIQQWYEQGKYQSYGMEKLIEVILHAKRNVHPWIRLNRVIRDIPVEYVLEGVECTNLRQLLQIRMTKEGRTCQCIRCREVKGDKELAKMAPTSVIVERTYKASRGTEVFVSSETPDRQTIFGFVRLRFPGGETYSATTSKPATPSVLSPDRRATPSGPGQSPPPRQQIITGPRDVALNTTGMREPHPFPELIGCALIRELHVYGNLIAADAGSGVGGVKTKLNTDSRAQHQGIGSRLMDRAETLAAAKGFQRIAVISGVGVRGYYRRRGYHCVDPHRGGFMIKTLPAPYLRDPFIGRCLRWAGCTVSAASGLVAPKPKSTAPSLGRSLGRARSPTHDAETSSFFDGASPLPRVTAAAAAAVRRAVSLSVERVGTDARPAGFTAPETSDAIFPTEDEVLRQDFEAVRQATLIGASPLPVRSAGAMSEDMAPKYRDVAFRTNVEAALLGPRRQPEEGRWVIVALRILTFVVVLTAVFWPQVRPSLSFV